MFGRLGILGLLVTGLSLIRCGHGSDEVHHESPLAGINPPEVGINREYGGYAFAANVTDNTYITGVRLRDANHKPITGLDLQLECYVQREGQPKSSNYTWWKDSKEIKSDDSGVKGQKSLILTILGLKKSDDDGNYTCTIANEAGKGGVGEYFKVTVGTFPVVSLTGPKRPLLSSDQNETLTCSVTATPPATIRWYLNDKLIDNINSKTYTIAEPGPADKGLYKCEATNAIGSGVAVYRVEVYYAPVGKPAVQPTISAIVANTTNNFSCNVETLENLGNPKATRYTWVYNNETMTSEEGQQVNIYQSSINDVVQLSCLLVNYYEGSEASSTADIRVEAPVYFESPPVPPENETEYTYSPNRDDSTFHLLYVISGTKVSDIQLDRNSSPLDVVTNKDFTKTETQKEGNYSFEQTSAMEVDFKWNLDKDELKELDECSQMSYFNGLYTLIVVGTAAGSPSKATTTFRIAAKFKPTWHGKTTLYAQLGEELQINCGVCASPEPSGYKWGFNSGSLGNGIEKENSGRNLRIKSVEEGHYGYYGCETSNELGPVKFRITVERPKGLSAGVIAGIVVICIVICAVIAGVIIFIVRRNRASDNGKERMHHAPTLREVDRERSDVDGRELQPPLQNAPSVPKTPRPGAPSEADNAIYEAIDDTDHPGIYMDMEKGSHVVPNRYAGDPTVHF